MQWQAGSSYDAKMIEQNTAAEPRKRSSIRHALSGWRSNGERGTSLAALAEPGVARSILYEDAAVDELGHPREIADVHRVHHGRVSPTAFRRDSEVDRLVRI